MQIMKYAPTILFTAFAVQLMILREFTYASGLITLILGAVAFMFSYYDSREDIKQLKQNIIDNKKSDDERYDELKKLVDESSSVLNAVKMQNKITNKRF